MLRISRLCDEYYIYLRTDKILQPRIELHMEMYEILYNKDS